MGSVNQRRVMPAPITLDRVRIQNIFTSEKYVGEKTCSGNSTLRKFGFYVGRIRESMWSVANG